VDFFEAVGKRRSVRAYQDVAVSADLLESILRACAQAPSAGNLQAYEIFAVADAEVRAALARAAFGQDFVRQAPAVLVFCANPDRARRYGERGATLYAPQDATIAATYAQLAATSLGLATCWVGAFDEGKAAEALSLDPPLRPIIILPIGVAAEEPGPGVRRSLSDLVHRV
jgi:nitroreductase